MSSQATTFTEVGTTGKGRVTTYSARTPISTADRARSWGSHLGVEYRLRLLNAFRHSSALCVSCWHGNGIVPARRSCSIPLTWAIGRIAPIGIWSGGPARQKRLLLEAIQETPANMHPRWTWTAAICVRAAAERQGRSQAMIWSEAGVAGALRFTQTTAHLLGPCLKTIGCDTCDTCKRLLPREVHRYTISLPSFHLRL